MTLPELFVVAKDNHPAPRLPVWRKNFDFGQGWTKMTDEFRDGKIKGVEDFIKQPKKDPIKMLKEKRKKRKKKIAGAINDADYQTENNQFRDLYKQHFSDDEHYDRVRHNAPFEWAGQAFSDQLHDLQTEIFERGDAEGPGSIYRSYTESSDVSLVQSYLLWARDEGMAPDFNRTRELNSIRRELEARGIKITSIEPAPVPLPPGQHEFWMGGKRFMWERIFSEPRKEMDIESVTMGGAPVAELEDEEKAATFKPPLTALAIQVIVEPAEPLVQKAIDLINSKSPGFLDRAGVKKIVLEPGDPGHFGMVKSDEQGVIRVSLDKIKSFLTTAADEDEVVKQVAITVAHEVGHLLAHFQGGEAPAIAEEQQMAAKLSKLRVPLFVQSAATFDPYVMWNGYYDTAADYWAELGDATAVKDFVNYVKLVKE